MTNMERAAAEGIEVLPEDCIAKVVSMTSPGDACRLSLVGRRMRSAAESDSVWERFLPSDYKQMILRALDPTPRSLLFSSKKLLYLWLSDHPLLLDHGTMSFSVHKWSGRRCFMLAPRRLKIVWGDTPRYWRWTSSPDSRFSEVAELLSVCWLEIKGKITTGMLSPKTEYGAYLVFKSTAGAYGFEYQPVEVAVGISEGGGDGSEATPTRTVYLEPLGEQRQRYQIIPRRNELFNFSNSSILSSMYRVHAALRPPRGTEAEAGVEVEREEERESEERQYPKVRDDGWVEVELGEYFNEGGEEREVEVSLMEVKGGNWKSGIVVGGIEIRPKHS